MKDEGLTDWYRQIVFAAVVLLVVGIAACFSGILSIDGRYTPWNLAAFCGQAYGDCNIKRCDCKGSPRIGYKQ